MLQHTHTHTHTHSHIHTFSFSRVFAFVCVRKLSGRISYGSSGRRLSVGVARGEEERVMGGEGCGGIGVVGDIAVDVNVLPRTLGHGQTDSSSQTVFTNYLTRCWAPTRQGREERNEKREGEGEWEERQRLVCNLGTVDTF